MLTDTRPATPGVSRRPDIRPRDLRLDSLRVTAAVAVVWLHVSAVAVTGRPNVHSAAWWVANVADGGARWSVPLFVMISGALLLSAASEVSPIEFYRRRAARLLVPLVSWTIFAYVFRIAIGQPLRFDAVAANLIGGVPFYHLWYLYMVAVLALFTPFLRQFVVAASPVLLRLFLVVSFSVAAIEVSVGALESRGAATFLGLFVPFVPYFVAGYYLRSVSTSRRLPVWVGVITVMVGAVLIGAATGLAYPLFGGKSFELTYAYFNPVVIVTSLCVYRCAIGSGDDPGPAGYTAQLARHVAPLTLGIYAVHPFWIALLGRAGLSASFVHPLLGIPLTTAVVLVLSLLTAAGLARVPFLKAVVV